jgi:hypothetical protein
MSTGKNRGGKYPDNASFLARVEKLKLAKNWTWEKTAEKLQVTRMVFHLIKKEKFGVSKRNLYRLEQLETKEGLRTPGAKELVEAVVSNIENSKIKITTADFDKGFVDVPVNYARGVPPKGHPAAIRLLRPNVKASAKLIVNLLASEDYGSVLLSCIQPRQFATQDFLNLLTPFSFQALSEAAMYLVFGIHWRQRLKKS